MEFHPATVDQAPPAASDPGRPRSIHLWLWVLYFAGWAALSIGPYLAPLWGGRPPEPQPGLLNDPKVIGLSILASWISFGFAAALAWRAGLTSRDLGLVRLRAMPLLVWALTSLALLIAVYGLVGMLFADHFKTVEPLTRALEGPWRWLLWMALAVTAGVVEEYVMRGYGIGLLRRFGVNPWIAAGITSVLFGALHIYQGLGATFVLALWGFILALPYLYTGSIWPGVIAHFLIDALAPVFV